MSKAQSYLIISIVFALIVSVFAVQNTENMTIYFLFWKVEQVSKVIIILASTAAGALVMLFLGFMWNYKKMKHIRTLEAEIKELKKKIETGTTSEKAAVEQHQVYP